MTMERLALRVKKSGWPSFQIPQTTSLLLRAGPEPRRIDMPTTTKEPEVNKRATASGQKHVERVRKICLKLPETTEKLSHGEPTFFVKKRVFAMCSINHHNDGHISVVIPAAIGVQAALIESSSKKFYR